ncbi:restriction endonuclease subunit R, partial [Bacillus cereus]
NIGQIVAHKHLALDELWEYYKTEIQESEVIQHLKAYDSLDSTEETNKQSSSSTPTKNHDDSIGQATEIGEGTLIGDAYLTTKLIEQKKKEDREREQKIIDIQKLLNLERKEAERILNQASVEQSVIKRPDLYFESKRKDIDITIKEKIVPDLLV